MTQFEIGHKILGNGWCEQHTTQLDFSTIAAQDERYPLCIDIDSSS